MSKAQWKQKPIDRAYGTPRHSDIEKLNMQVADLMARLDLQLQKTEMWQSRVEQLKERVSEQAQQLKKLHDIHRAYKFLSITGVVMEHDGEFKHLQGEDMDKFFGIEETPRVTTKSAAIGSLYGASIPTKLLTPKSTQQEALRLIQMEFDKAYQQYLSERLKWQAPQKPW